jgi:hypothetical protein
MTMEIFQNTMKCYISSCKYGLQWPDMILYKKLTSSDAEMLILFCSCPLSVNLCKHSKYLIFIPMNFSFDSLSLVLYNTEYAKMFFVSFIL